MPLQLPMYRSQHPPEPAPVSGLLGGQQPTSNLYGVPVHVAYKRPAMLSSEYGHSSVRRTLLEPLKIDTELKKVLTTFAAFFIWHPLFMQFMQFAVLFTVSIITVAIASEVTTLQVISLLFCQTVISAAFLSAIS